MRLRLNSAQLGLEFGLGLSLAKFSGGFEVGEKVKRKPNYLDYLIEMTHPRFPRIPPASLHKVDNR